MQPCKLYNAECKKSLQVLSAPALYEVKWHVAKYGDPYSELVLCI